MDRKQKSIKAATVNAKRDNAKGFKAPGGPVPPVPLSRMDRDTKAAWVKITQAMPGGIISEIDSLALYALCRSWSIWRFWESKCSTESVAESYKASCMAASSLKAMMGLMAKFGLTPKDRRDLADPDAQPGGDPFSKFLETLQASN